MGDLSRTLSLCCEASQWRPRTDSLEGLPLGHRLRPALNGSSYFLLIRKLTADPERCKLLSAVAVPTKSSSARSTGGASAATESSRSIESLPASSVALPAVTFAGRLLISSEIGPL